MFPRTEECSKTRKTFLYIVSSLVTLGPSSFLFHCVTLHMQGTPSAAAEEQWQQFHNNNNNSSRKLSENSQQVNELLCASPVNPKHKYVLGPTTPAIQHPSCLSTFVCKLLGEDEITSLLSFTKVPQRFLLILSRISSSTPGGGVPLPPQTLVSSLTFDK